MELYVTTQQEREIAALREYYYPERSTLRKISLDDLIESEKEERTRIFGPFDLEVLAWVNQMSVAKIDFVIGRDADGRDYLEF